MSGVHSMSGRQAAQAAGPRLGRGRSCGAELCMRFVGWEARNARQQLLTLERDMLFLFEIWRAQRPPTAARAWARVAAAATVLTDGADSLDLGGWSSLCGGLASLAWSDRKVAAFDSTVLTATWILSLQTRGRHNFLLGRPISSQPSWSAPSVH